MTPAVGMTMYLVTKLLSGDVESEMLDARDCLRRAESINASRGFDGQTLFAQCQWVPPEGAMPCLCDEVDEERLLDLMVDEVPA